MVVRLEVVLVSILPSPTSASIVELSHEVLFDFLS
jgi:hypothetical protein